MKILQVIPAFYPSQIWGGPPQNTYILCKNLIARGHDVHILTTNILDYQLYMSDQSIQSSWMGIPVTYLKSYWWGRKHNSVGYILAPDIWRYRRLIQNADIIHIHGYRNFLFTAGSLLAQLYRIPYIVQPRGALTNRFGRVRQKIFFDQTIGHYILRRASYAISLSDEEIENLVLAGISINRIAKIYNPVDPDLWPGLPDGSHFKEKYQINSNDKIILFLSRIHEKKGLDKLIEAFASIDRTDMRLCIVGPDDGYLSTAKALIQKYGIETKTIVTGPLYGKEKFEAYRAADIYVLPTRGGEGLPTTIIEACYAGLPIIVTNTTEISKFINNRIGFAVNDNQTDIKDALMRLLNEPNLRSHFREQTKEFLDEYFNLDRAIDQFEQIYRLIVCHHP